MSLHRSSLTWFAFATACLVAIGAVAAVAAKPAAPPAAADSIGKVTKTDAEWRKLLSPQAYKILRQKGTEIAFTGNLWDEHRAGTYSCAGCALTLFSSTTKYDSGTGWPSFWAPLAKDRVRGQIDTSYGSVETEIVCARCGGHLGHVFDDGPKPSGMRYCMNSAAMTFRPKTGK